jgi:serine/threonine protein kinase
MMNLVGHNIGTYKLLRLVESSSSSQIYFGECQHDRSCVAVKVSNSREGNRQTSNLELEARTLSRTKHRHIIRMHDFGKQNGIQFLITNWATRGTLLNLFAQPVPIRTVAAYVKQIASALEYLHTMDIIHQDVKPTNILIDQDETALVSDFETAIDYRRNHPGRAGTAAYSAPEQRQRQSCPASDQYALGVLVYHWLCGEIPFQGSPAEMLAQHRDVPPSPLQDKVPELPYAVDQVVLTALEKKPGVRFPSVRVFAEALEEACQSSSYLTPSGSPQDYGGHTSLK